MMLHFALAFPDGRVEEQKVLECHRNYGIIDTTLRIEEKLEFEDQIIDLQYDMRFKFNENLLGDENNDFSVLKPSDFKDGAAVISNLVINAKKSLDPYKVGEQLGERYSDCSLDIKFYVH